MERLGAGTALSGEKTERMHREKYVGGRKLSSERKREHDNLEYSQG